MKTVRLELKKYIVLVLILVNGWIGYSQSGSYDSEIRRDHSVYNESLNKRDFAKTYEYTIVKIFETISRKEFDQSLNERYANAEYTFTFIPPAYQFNGKTETTPEGVFVSFGTIQYIRVKMHNTSSLITDEFFATLLEPLRLKLEQSYGKDNVRFDQSQRLFTIKCVQTLVAHLGNRASHWRFAIVGEPGFVQAVPEAFKTLAN